jgi:hypothetical protein
MINRAALQQAFDILEYLQGRGIQAIIAGGCARDIFFGVKPKDIDIIVVDCSVNELNGLLAEANVASRLYHFYGDSQSDRIVACWKFQSVDIDVVLYDCETVTEAIDALDFNLNQFAIVGTRHGIDGASVRFLGDDHWRKLVPVRQDFTPERHQKMLMKYLDLVPRRATGEPLNEVPVGGDHGAY